MTLSFPPVWRSPKLLPSSGSKIEKDLLRMWTWLPWIYVYVFIIYALSPDFEKPHCYATSYTWVFIQYHQPWYFHINKDKVTIYLVCKWCYHKSSHDTEKSLKTQCNYSPRREYTGATERGEYVTKIRQAAWRKTQMRQRNANNAFLGNKLSLNLMYFSNLYWWFFFDQIVLRSSTFTPWKVLN